MSSKPRMNWIASVSLAIIVACILTLVILVPQFVSVAGTVASREAPSAAPAAPTLEPTASPALIQARAALARVRDEIVPREGLATDYGVTFSDAGYQTLIQWNEEFKVEPRYADAFESLDFILPCCDWRKPSRDETTNCACGHHQTLEGLSKKLLSDGWSRDAVQREVSSWTRYLFPQEAVRAEMEQRAQLDPEMKAVLEELKARGEC
ncbi:MAG: hypothetical protein KGJ80_05375 [Chloroflexota bacterium]|nr:hypothetical protein [Chloroflexota bacterium]